MVALDVNIVLELLEKRKRVKLIQDLLSDYKGQDVQFGLSTLSVSHAFYLAESHKIPSDSVELLISSYAIFTVVPEDVTWALKHYGGNDFEDALQVAAARRAGAKLFVTLDAKLATKYQKFLPIKLVK